MKEGNQQQQQQQQLPQKKKRQTNTNPSKLGRKGDPRMHTAVKARLTDPKLELMHALERGGFTFTEKPSGAVVDADNITLNQRKNQLSRRVRLFKQRVKDEENLMNGNGNGSGNGLMNGIGNSNGIGNALKLQGGYLTDPTITSTNKKRSPVHVESKAAMAMAMAISAGSDCDGDGDVDVDAFTIPHAGKKRRMPMPPLRGSDANTNVNGNANGNANAQGKDDPKLDKALDDFKIGIASLFKKTMINAGYHAAQMDECDEAYLTFVETALQGELKRVRRIKKRLYSKPGPGATHISSEESISHDDHGHDHSHEHTRRHEHSHGHDHDHSHNAHSNSQDCLHSRHLHRLEGKCGHKAIVHKPLNGKPHIDFLVNGKVECYEGYNPKMDSSAFWPSQLKVGQGPPTHSDHNDEANSNQNRIGSIGNGVGIVNGHPTNADGQLDGERAQVQAKARQLCEDPNCSKLPKFDPTVFDLKDIDLACGEWESILADDNSNAIGDDEVLGSLFSLRNNNKTAGVDHGHEHGHDHSHSQNAHSNSQRQLHRHNGKCSHKTIVHKPLNGKPHIDFLVNGKVECYEGYNPKVDTATFWPSQLKVGQGPPTHSERNDEANSNRNRIGSIGSIGNGGGTVNGNQANADGQGGGEQAQSKSRQLCEDPNCKSSAYDPIIFDLKDIDFSCGEWESILDDDDDAADDTSNAVGF